MIEKLIGLYSRCFVWVCTNLGIPEPIATVEVLSEPVYRPQPPQPGSETNPCPTCKRAFREHSVEGVKECLLVAHNKRY